MGVLASPRPDSLCSSASSSSSSSSTSSHTSSGCSTPMNSPAAVGAEAPTHMGSAVASANAADPFAARQRVAAAAHCGFGDQRPSTPRYELVSNLVELRGLCHVNLVDAEFRIMHDERNGGFAIELLAGSRIVLHVACRLLHAYERIRIQSTSYGIREPDMFVPSRLRDGDHCHLHVHVYRHYYTMVMNGVEMVRFAHRLPFQQIDSNSAVHFLPTRRPAADVAPTVFRSLSQPGLLTIVPEQKRADLLPIHFGAIHRRRRHTESRQESVDEAAEQPPKRRRSHSNAFRSIEALISPLKSEEEEECASAEKKSRS